MELAEKDKSLPLAYSLLAVTREDLDQMDESDDDGDQKRPGRRSRPDDESDPEEPELDPSSQYHSPFHWTHRSSFS